MSDCKLLLATATDSVEAKYEKSNRLLGWKPRGLRTGHIAPLSNGELRDSEAQWAWDDFIFLGGHMGSEGLEHRPPDAFDQEGSAAWNDIRLPPNQQPRLRYFCCGPRLCNEHMPRW